LGAKVRKIGIILSSNILEVRQPAPITILKKKVLFGKHGILIFSVYCFFCLKKSAAFNLVVPKHPGSSQFCIEDPGYSRRFLQSILSFFFNFARIFKDTVPIAEILSGKNVRAWVSIFFT
jgi:hypothetical protein